MCGRFALTHSAEALTQHFHLPDRPTWQPRWNIAPTQFSPVIRQNSAGVREFGMLRWGLVPHWAKEEAIGAKMINARSETVAEKPAFRKAIRSRRCLIPASGFYEWRHETKAKGKVPFYLTMKDGSPLGLAGIWESWQALEENILETFSILTTTANSLMAPIHDRMPVILAPEDFAPWLDHTLVKPENLNRLYQPFPAEFLQLWQVSSLVNSPVNDSAGCVLPLQ